MNKNSVNPKFLTLAIMILAAAFSRLIPHPPNFTAVAAIALFGGTYFDKKWNAFLIPITAMFLTDIQSTISRGSSVDRHIQGPGEFAYGRNVHNKKITGI